MMNKAGTLHNATIHRNFQKNSGIIFNAIIDRVCLEIPKQCIVGYSLTRLNVTNLSFLFLSASLSLSFPLVFFSLRL